MNYFQAILFDFDGTLMDTTELIIEAFKYTVLKHLNREITAEELYPSFGKPLIAALEELSPGHGQELIITYRQYTDQYHDQMVTVFDQVPETLEKLRQQKVKMAIVTSKMRSAVERGLDLFDLKPYFDALIAVEDTHIHKPYPEPVFRALEILDTKPCHAIMVGDSPHDLKSAHQAGVKAAAVRWSSLPWESIIAEKPEFILNKMEDLIEIITRDRQNPLVS
ncbi:MAG TPA: pyrophosphatase PpaX [Clostridia bacterium]|nr:pyrophosphatase PpaX [Clostridia bacterium]